MRPRTEGDNGTKRSDGEEPVHDRHINLTTLVAGSVETRMRGRNPSWIDCRVREYAPEMIACDAMMVAIVANATMRVVGPPGGEQIERIGDRARVGQQQCNCSPR